LQYLLRFAGTKVLPFRNLEVPEEAMHKRLLQVVCLTGALVAPAISPGQLAPPTSEPVSAPAARKPGAADALDDTALARSARASKLIGSRLYANDAVVGAIEDILIDREHSAVTAAIISVGGFLGVGEKRIAIPINQINLAGEARFTINMSKEELSNAPAFDFAKLK
jgi:sporulation protein YlmC with PRC-barrel domain